MFDLISSEYGWSDKKILKLRIRRLRQIIAAISRRRYFEDRKVKSLASWQTRMTAQYIAAGYMIAEGKENEGLAMAQVLAFDEIEKQQLEELSRAAKDIPLEDSVKAGSFERMMGLMSTRGGFQK
jgi:hypothetical protein